MDSFKELTVWQKSHELALSIYKATKEFPAEERFALISQLRRAASSIPANIAEGFSRKTIGEYIQFLFNGRGSLSEVEYFLVLSLDLGYLKKEKYEELHRQVRTVGKLLNGLINSLRNKKENKK